MDGMNNKVQRRVGSLFRWIDLVEHLWSYIQVLKHINVGFSKVADAR